MLACSTLKLSPPHPLSFYLPAGNETPLGLQIRPKRKSAGDRFFFEFALKLPVSLSVVDIMLHTNQTHSTDSPGGGEISVNHRQSCFSVFKISAGSVGTSSI